MRRHINENPKLSALSSAAHLAIPPKKLAIRTPKKSVMVMLIIHHKIDKKKSAYTSTSSMQVSQLFGIQSVFQR